MGFDLAIRGGTVVLPETDGAAVDIAISNGRIAAVLAPGAAVDVAETLNVTGKTVLPGVIDVHLHLGHGKDIARPRVPEDAATETAAAAIGGVTAFVPYLMATDPFETLFDEVKSVTAAAPVLISVITSSFRPRRSLRECRAMPATSACRLSRFS